MQETAVGYEEQRTYGASLLLLRVLGRLPLQSNAHTRAAGASREKTAGQVRSATPRTMGKVALADVWRSALAIECGGREALADGDEHAWRRIWRLRAWWKRQRCHASIRHQRARPCRRSRIGGTCEDHLSVALA